MSRYVVKPMPPHGCTFGIYDELLRDFCGLPREPGGPGWWLEWADPDGPQRWLDHCRRVWAKWPDSAPAGR